MRYICEAYAAQFGEWVTDSSCSTKGNSMVFEWDEDKNKINIKKHGIDFETAMLVFNDIQRIEIYLSRR